MTKKWGLAESFRHYGAAGANPRWSWSARSPDGDTVVMTLWKDEFDYSNKPATYSTYGRWTNDLTNRLGNIERLENLVWARDKCGGKFRVVITVAEDTRAQPRKIASCFPQDRIVMKITDLNEETGEFSAVMV